MRYRAPRGAEDVLPDESHLWQSLEQAFREHCRLYGYVELRTPTFEETELFVRTSGETSEVVSKQMYSFVDRGGRPITLKPEGTAPAMRALIEHSLIAPGSVVRVFYVTPVFRYERPQKGRLRESHQVGIELVGSASPLADAEVIEFTVRFYERIGLKGLRVLLNSLGRAECRTRYREALWAYAEPRIASSEPGFFEKARKNPLRLLDSKDRDVQDAMSDAPRVLDFLEPESTERLAQLKRLLDEAGIEYEFVPELVRGLDYYTETVFEVQSSALGAQNALCGGGRYDDLARELGGPDTPSVGVAMGIERALIVQQEAGQSPQPGRLDVFVVGLGEGSSAEVRKLAASLRTSGISCLYDFDAPSLRSQLNKANRLGARFAAIIGESELARGVVALRDMEAGEQREVPLALLVEHLGGRRT
jgi:histidyl-tRNA synthetase